MLPGRPNAVEHHSNFRVRRQHFPAIGTSGNDLIIDGIPGSKGIAFVSALVVNTTETVCLPCSSRVLSMVFRYAPYIIQDGDDLRTCCRCGQEEPTMWLFGTNDAETEGGKPRTQVHTFWSNDPALAPSSWKTAKILQLPQNGTAPPGSYMVPWWTAFNTSPTKAMLGERARFNGSALSLHVYRYYALTPTHLHVQEARMYTCWPSSLGRLGRTDCHS